MLIKRFAENERTITKYNRFMKEEPAMKMTFRWYGSAIDPIPLKYVKQIPGMTGLMGLLDKPAGVDWPEEEFVALKKEVDDAGLEIEVIESVNVHEDIKMGLPTREDTLPIIFPPSACWPSTA